MATTVPHTIGASQDYAAPSLWQTDQRRDLVAADEIAQGRVVGSVNVGPFFISNVWVTDNTRYCHLTYDSSYHGGINGTGAAFVCTDSSSAPYCVHFLNAVGKDFRFTGLRFRSTRSGGDDWGIYMAGNQNTVVVERCMFSDGLGIGVQTDANGDELWWINSISIINGAKNQAIDLHDDTGLVVRAYGGLFLTGSIFIATTTAATRNGYDLDIRNSLFADDPGITVGTDSGNPWNAACDQNIFAGTSGTDRGVPGTKLESVTFQAGTGGSGTRVMLEDITGGSLDLHLIRNADNAALDFGNDLSAVSLPMGASMTLDLDEVARTASVWDAGPDETVNVAPTVDAGEDQEIQLPDGATLDGTATDDIGDPVTVEWTQTSGPGTATFDDDEAEDTTVTFDVSGEYVLRLTATDGEEEDFDELTITVLPADSITANNRFKPFILAALVGD